MKISKKQLRRIIKEEKAKLLNEAPTASDMIADVADIIRSLGDIVEITSMGQMETPDMGGLDLELQEEVADFVGDAIVNLNRALSTLAVPPINIPTLREEGLRRIIQEMNPDGTVSGDEDEARYDLLARTEVQIDELIQYVRDEAERIGGGFRSPGIRAEVFKLLADKIHRAR